VPAEGVDLNAPAMDAAAMWPLALYAVSVVVLVGGLLMLSHILGERHLTRQSVEPYESGVAVVGSARVRLSAKFYLVAMFFVIFDVETVYIFAWAISFRQSGWAGFIEIGIFIIVLLAALFYLWMLGALDWAPLSGKRRKEVRRHAAETG
jgi:NADH-quinone oxidoreductase subunit A